MWLACSSTGEGKEGGQREEKWQGDVRRGVSDIEIQRWSSSSHGKVPGRSPCTNLTDRTGRRRRMLSVMTPLRSDRGRRSTSCTDRVSPAPPRLLHHVQARLAQATPLPLLPPSSSSSAEAGGSSGLSLQARLGELPVLLGLLLAREARLLRALQEVMRGGGRGGGKRRGGGVWRMAGGSTAALVGSKAAPITFVQASCLFSSPLCILPLPARPLFLQAMRACAHEDFFDE